MAAVAADGSGRIPRNSASGPSELIAGHRVHQFLEVAPGAQVGSPGEMIGINGRGGLLQFCEACVGGVVQLLSHPEIRGGRTRSR